MRATIAAYRFKVIHIPGKENIADTLCRLTDQHTKSCAKVCVETEEYVRFVAENATACALPTREIERAAAIDKELSSIRECIQKGQWKTLDKKRYLMVRSKLSLIGKLVLRGTRIIVSSSLRERAQNVVHEGHPEIVLMKRRRRAKVRWPDRDKDAERFCKSCPPCQMVSMPTPPPEPLKRTELPSGPWQHISADLMTHYLQETTCL